MKKPTFGFTGYNPKATVKDMLPVKVNKYSKGKRKMFCEEAQKAKGFIPGSDKYQSEIDWNKNPNTRNHKFGKDARLTVAGEIKKKSEKKETCSPGPVAYNEYDTWRKKVSPRTKGSYKYHDSRITFVKERQWHANQTPGFKYPNVKLVSTMTEFCVQYYRY